MLDVGHPHWPGPRFVQHGARVLWNYSSHPLHLILGLPQLLVCPWGIQNLMRVVQRLPVLLTTWPVQFHLSLLIISLRSLSLVFSLRVHTQMGTPVGMSESLHRQRCRATGECEAPQTKSWVSRPPLNGLVPKKTLLRVNYNTCDISNFIALIFCPQRGLNNYLRSKWSRTVWTTAYWLGLSRFCSATF